VSYFIQCCLSYCFPPSTVLRKEVSSTPASPQKEMLFPFKRSVSAPGGEDDAGEHFTEQHADTFHASEVRSVETNCMPLKAISVYSVTAILRFAWVCCSFFSLLSYFEKNGVRL
jgi:hypothetical protein